MNAAKKKILLEILQEKLVDLNEVIQNHPDKAKAGRVRSYRTKVFEIHNEIFNAPLGQSVFSVASVEIAPEQSLFRLIRLICEEAGVGNDPDLDNIRDIATAALEPKEDTHEKT